MKAGRNR
jgi:predicted PurR-regulated permease PerM